MGGRRNRGVPKLLGMLHVMFFWCVVFIEYDEILLKNSTEILYYNKSLYEVLRNRVWFATLTGLKVSGQMIATLHSIVPAGDIQLNTVPMSEVQLKGTLSTLVLCLCS